MISCCEYVLLPGLQENWVPNCTLVMAHPPTCQAMSRNIPYVIGPGVWMASDAPICGVMSEFSLPDG